MKARRTAALKLILWLGVWVAFNVFGSLLPATLKNWCVPISFLLFFKTVWHWWYYLDKRQEYKRSLKDWEDTARRS